MRTWLTGGAQSGEIVRLWACLAPTQVRGATDALLSSISALDDTNWVHKLIAELDTRWQSAPTPIQETAALWLSTNVPDTDETRSGLWALYSEWDGTLPDLVNASAKL